MMKKFKVKKKHLLGEIADFPKRVVQAMVDEQVRQGNPADPSVFSARRGACKREGGFTWMNSCTSGYSWPEIILYKKFHLIPKREKPREKPRRKKMNIEQITRRVSDYEARENIHQQFLKEILILGEREALEFARFRADALADANEQAARQAKQSFHRALIIGALYTAATAFAIGFMIGRAV